MTRLDATFATQARCTGLTPKGLVPIADDLLDDVWVLPHGVGPLSADGVGLLFWFGVWLGDAPQTLAMLQCCGDRVMGRPV